MAGEGSLSTNLGSPPRRVMPAPADSPRIDEEGNLSAAV